MAVSPDTLALEYSNNADFSGSATVTVPVLVVLPTRPRDEEATVHFGKVMKQATDWRRRFVVTADITTVESSDNDYGDFLALETALLAPYLRIIATGTDLTRVDGSGNFMDNLLSSPFEVVCTAGPDLASDPEHASDQATFTLEAVHVNT